MPMSRPFRPAPSTSCICGSSPAQPARPNACWRKPDAWRDPASDTKNHVIKNRLVEINQAIKRNAEVPEEIKLKSLRKLFVGGLTSEMTRDDLIGFFSRYGAVANAYVIYDPITRESKSRQAYDKISDM